MISILSMQHTGTWSLIRALETLTGTKCLFHPETTEEDRLIHSHARNFKGSTAEGLEYHISRGYMMIIPIRDPLQSIITRHNRHSHLDHSYLIDGFESLAGIDKDRYFMSNIAQCHTAEEHGKEIDRIAYYFGLSRIPVDFRVHNRSNDVTGLKRAYDSKDLAPIEEVLGKYIERLRRSTLLLDFLTDNDIDLWWAKN